MSNPIDDRYSLREECEAMRALQKLCEHSVPPEYPKPRAIVPDCLVAHAREMWGDKVEVIPMSETILTVEELTRPSESEETNNG